MNGRDGVPGIDGLPGRHGDKGKDGKDGKLIIFNEYQKKICAGIYTIYSIEIHIYYLLFKSSSKLLSP